MKIQKSPLRFWSFFRYSPKSLFLCISFSRILLLDEFFYVTISFQISIFLWFFLEQWKIEYLIWYKIVVRKRYSKRKKGPAGEAFLHSCSITFTDNIFYIGTSAINSLIEARVFNFGIFGADLQGGPPLSVKYES